MTFFACIGIASCVVSGGLLLLALYSVWKETRDASND